MGTPLEIGNPILNSLVGYWPLLEGGGSLAQDLSGNKRDGVITGAAWIVGESGPFLSFDDTGKYVTCAPFVANCNRNMTIIMRVRASAGDSSGGLLYKGTGYSASESDFYLYWYDSDSGIQFGAGDGASVFATNDLGDAALLPDGVWTTLAVTREIQGTDLQVAKLYRNGVFYDDAVSYLTANNTTSSALTIGRVGWSTQAFNGDIDNVIVFSRALSPSEIVSLYRDSSQLFRRPQIELWYAAMGGEEPPSEVTLSGIINGHMNGRMNGVLK